jgi:anti-sigma factor RsiW
VNCTDFLAKLTDYFDGHIDPDLLHEVKQHIGTCHHCEVVVDTTRKTIEVYRGNQTYELPEDLHLRMKAAVMKRCLETGRLPDIELKGKQIRSPEEFLKEQAEHAKH